MRTPRTISMEVKTWELAQKIAKEQNTNLSRIMENTFNERYVPKKNPKKEK